MKITVLFLSLSLIAGVDCAGAEKEKPTTRREINFDGEIVEGAARQSMDSLTQTSDSAKKTNINLYEKREKIQEKSSERVREIIETF